MEKTQNTHVKRQQNRNQRLYQNIKSVKHFSYEIPLPAQTIITRYQSENGSNKSQNTKGQQVHVFKYVKEKKTGVIHKILPLNQDRYIDQGQYPFTDPEGKVKQFSGLQFEEILTKQAAYIGHIENDLIIKKIQGVKLENNGTQFETVDEQFQVIPIGNEKRFNQFVKLMSLNSNSIGMSIRVVIDETSRKQPEVLDFEFFYRQRELLRKHSF